MVAMKMSMKPTSLLVPIFIRLPCLPCANDFGQSLLLNTWVVIVSQKLPRSIRTAVHYHQSKANMDMMLKWRNISCFSDSPSNLIFYFRFSTIVEAVFTWPHSDLFNETVFFKFIKAIFSYTCNSLLFNKSMDKFIGSLLDKILWCWIRIAETKNPKKKSIALCYHLNLEGFSFETRVYILTLCCFNIYFCVFF